MQLAGWSSGPEATGHQGEWLSPTSGDCAGSPDAVDHVASLVDRSAAAARLEPTDGGVPGSGHALHESTANHPDEPRLPRSPTHHCRGCNIWSNASSSSAWSSASDPTDGRATHAILTDRGFQTLAEAAPGHGLLYVADAVGGRSRTAHRIAIELLAHARAVPTTALAVVTEHFRDWAMPLAGPARDA
jgi:hypothetical protein